MAQRIVKCILAGRDEVIEVTWIDVKTKVKLVERYTAPPAYTWQARAELDKETKEIADKGITDKDAR
jgi:hypothetical protein